LSDLSEHEAYDGIRKQLLDEVTKSWDGEELLRSRNAKRPDLDYMKLWGQHVGMGRIDLWKYEDYLNKLIE
jgi:hypothetical protein